MRRIVPALTIAAAVGLATAPAAFAARSCNDIIAETQKEWDRMVHQASEAPMPQVADNFRIAKELCKQGKDKEAHSYLDVVRSHLYLPLVGEKRG